MKSRWACDTEKPNGRRPWRSSSRKTKPPLRRSCVSTPFRWSTSAASLSNKSARRASMRRRYALLLTLCFAPLAHGNDFPTRARVEFVLTCMRESKAPREESMYKCSCAIDAIADKVDYNTWVDLSTIANATPIAGERGGVMRDLKDGRKLISSYRELQESAKKSCLIG